MTPDIAARLAEFQIQLMAEARNHFLFVRGQFLIIVERAGNGFGSLGSTGVMTENGLAYVVWRDGRPMLVAKSSEIPADEAQLTAMRRFSDDLRSALRL